MAPARGTRTKWRRRLREEKEEEENGGSSSGGSGPRRFARTRSLSARGPHTPPPPPQRLPSPPGPRCRRVPSRRRRPPRSSSSSSAAALGPPPPRAAIGRGRGVSRAHWLSATPVNLAATSRAGPALLRFPSAAAAAVRARRGRGLAARGVTCPAPVTWWRRPPGNGGERGGKREGKGEKGGGFRLARTGTGTGSRNGPPLPPLRHGRRPPSPHALWAAPPGGRCV
ncbi:translation initiation factor IF-2-like [Pyrgilauda ruficollis]|uniref:translation initiation factor IF-2-like n=1 Tax=Pyrgilauda ruficollis TaxID=221976 RepID=UPI001B871C68|nr:translation initiation factor IF-2-like [Pyrgilauda ruficollis]